MPAVPDTFAPPGILAEWRDNASSAVKITLCDNSNCEAGYRVYRAPGFSSAFGLIAQIKSAHPGQRDTLTLSDSTVVPNAFYTYRAAAWRRRGDSALSRVSAVYTFHLSGGRRPAHFTRLADFPLALSGGWSALAGDSVILQENTSPAGKYTVIDVQNPSAPASAGFIDSSALASYPLASLIPIYLSSKVVNGYGFVGGKGVFCMKKKYAVVVNAPDITLFKFGNKAFTRIGSYRDENIAAVLPLNDSLLCVVSGNISAADGSYSYLYPVLISPTAGIVIGNLVEIGSFRNGAASTSLSPQVRGVYNRTLLIGETFTYYPFNSWHYMVAYDLDSMQSLASPSVGEASWRNYSGYPLSAGQFLSLDADHVYAEDPRDLNAYRTALDDGAVLPDSLHDRQNVLVDTVKKRLFILHSTGMSIFKYDFPPAAGGGKSLENGEKYAGELQVSPGESGVTIAFPGSARHADLIFYDLWGRIVDRVTVTGRSSVVWRPKDAESGCFTVSAKLDGVDYEARFIAR
jgi:hypothetical protein